MRLRSFAAYGLSISCAAGHLDEVGIADVRRACRRTTSFSASAIRCTLADEPAPSGASLKPSSTFSASTSASPPDDGGGNV
jgi:hypothetical protein